MRTSFEMILSTWLSWTHLKRHHYSGLSEILKTFCMEEGRNQNNIDTWISTKAKDYYVLPHNGLSGRTWASMVKFNMVAQKRK